MDEPNVGEPRAQSERRETHLDGQPAPTGDSTGYSYQGVSDGRPFSQPGLSPLSSRSSRSTESSDHEQPGYGGVDRHRSLPADWEEDEPATREDDDSSIDVNNVRAGREASSADSDSDASSTIVRRIPATQRRLAVKNAAIRRNIRRTEIHIKEIEKERRLAQSNRREEARLDQLNSQVIRLREDLMAQQRLVRDAKQAERAAHAAEKAARQKILRRQEAKRLEQEQRRRDERDGMVRSNGQTKQKRHAYIPLEDEQANHDDDEDDDGDEDEEKQRAASNKRQAIQVTNEIMRTARLQTFNRCFESTTQRIMDIWRQRSSVWSAAPGEPSVEPLFLNSGRLRTAMFANRSKWYSLQFDNLSHLMRKNTRLEIMLSLSIATPPRQPNREETHAIMDVMIEAAEQPSSKYWLYIFKTQCRRGQSLAELSAGVIMNVAFAFREVHRFNAESPVELRRAAEKMPDGDIADYILDPRCIFAAADEGGEVRSE